MDVIPVLDLKTGRAVHARRGQRNTYAVASGVLGSGDDVLALAAAFRDRLGCRTLYVADLDAIAAAGRRTLGAGSAAVNPLLADLAALGLSLWVDAAVRTPGDAEALLDAGAARVVVGLETLPGMAALRPILDRLGAARVVFSLDLRDGQPLAADPALTGADPVEIARMAATAGAPALIALDLARVGASAGPPLPLLERLRAALPAVELYAGGGVRDVQDLERLARASCAGALVATALHEGAIGRADVQALASAWVDPGATAPEPRLR